MPIDPNVVPAFQTPNPVAVAGQLTSLKHMQAQQEQQKQLAPLVYQQAQAQATQAQIQTQQMQKQQADQQVWQDAHKAAAGDLDETRRRAEAGGASLDSLNTFDNNRNTAVINAAKARTAQSSIDDDNSDKFHGRLYYFNQKPQADQDAQADDFMGQAHKDGLIKDDAFLAYQKAHPKGSPPTPAQWEDYQHNLKSYTMIQSEAAAKVKMDAAAEAAAGLAASRKSTADKNNLDIQEKQQQDLVRKMTGSQTLDQWNQNLLDSGQPMDAFGAPPFKPDGTRDPAGMARVNRLGMTPQQIAANEEAAKRDTGTDDYRKATLRQGDQRIAQGQERNRQSANAQKLAAASVASKAFTNNGGDHDKAIAEITNSVDPAVQAMAMPAIALLTSAKTHKLDPAKEQSQIDKNNRDPKAAEADLLNTLMGGTAPAAPGKPAVPPKPAAKPAGITVKAGDGTAHAFPNEAAARKFEDLVRKAGGSTTRQ